MGTKPTKSADNIYCQCRKEAAIYNEKMNSREGAAEMLGIHPSSLADYELGITKVVPVDKIVLMADAYNAPELKNYYCREVCPLGAGIPKLELEDLDRISVKALSTFRKMAEAREQLLDIVEDGVIDDDEKPELDKVLATLDEINIITSNLKLWVEKNLERR